MRIVRPGILAAVLAFAIVAAGCAADPATEHPAASTIDELLELRADDVRDVDAYVPYFEESSLATALAEGSTEETGTPQIPRWEPPYVSEETTDGASVVVIWKKSADFPDWPYANVFTLKQLDDRWIVTDAIETTSPPEPVGKASE